MPNLSVEVREHQTYLIKRINAYHAAAQRHIDELVNAHAAGTLLLEAKETCRHGEWLSWLELHFDGSLRIAQRYMQIARRWQRIVEVSSSSVSHLNVRTASQLARNGQPITERHTRV